MTKMGFALQLEHTDFKVLVSFVLLLVGWLFWLLLLI